MAVLRERFGNNLAPVTIPMGVVMTFRRR